MNKNHIVIKNYRGIRNATAEFNKHLLVLGDNAQGKSSLADAIRRALAGEGIAASQAGKYQNRNGGDPFSVKVSTDGHDAFLTKAGVHSDGDHHDPFAVGLRQVTTTKMSDIIAHLCKITDTNPMDYIDAYCKVTPSGDAIAKGVKQYFVDRDVWDRDSLANLLHWDKAEEYYADEARHNKRAWMKITGEQWGSEKGANWMSPDTDHRMAEHTPDALRKMLRDTADAAVRREGQVEEAEKAHKQALCDHVGAVDEYKSLRLDNRSPAEAEKHLDNIKEDVLRWEGEVAECKRRNDGRDENARLRESLQGDIARLEGRIKELDRNYDKASEMQARDVVIKAFADMVEDSDSTSVGDILKRIDGGIMEDVKRLVYQKEQAWRGTADWMHAMDKEQYLTCPECKASLVVTVPFGDGDMSGQESLEKASPPSEEEIKRRRDKLATDKKAMESARNMRDEWQKLRDDAWRIAERHRNWYSARAELTKSIDETRDRLAKMPPVVDRAPADSEGLDYATECLRKARENQAATEKFTADAREKAAQIRQLEEAIRKAEERVKSLQAMPLAEAAPYPEAEIRAALRAQEATDTATQAHDEIMHSEAMRLALGARGIRKLAVQGAVNYFNDYAYQAAAALWARPFKLSLDIEGGGLYANGSPVAFMSESEQWLVDLIYQLAVAAKTEARMIVVDRLDVLDGDNLNGSKSFTNNSGTGMGVNILAKLSEWACNASVVACCVNDENNVLLHRGEKWDSIKINGGFSE